MSVRNLRDCGSLAVLASLCCLAGPQAGGAAPAGGQSVWNRPADTRAIAAIEQRLTDSSKLDRASDLLSDKVVVVDAFASGARRGKVEVLQTYRAHKERLGGAKGRYTELTIVTTPTFACSASQIRYEPPKPGGGAPTELRKLDVFKKTAGRWQLVQQHTSVAFDRKTDRVTDEPLTARGALTWKDSVFGETAIDPAVARQGIVDWTEQALRELGLGSAMKFIAPGKDVLVYGEFHPGNLRTREEVTAYWGPLYDSFTGLHVKSPVFEVETDGLLGAQIDTQDITIDMKDGSKPQISIRQSDCLRQFDGKWQTFLEAVSYAADPKTGKIVRRSADLKP